MTRSRVSALLATAALLAAAPAPTPDARAAGTPPPRAAKGSADSAAVGASDSTAAGALAKQARAAAEQHYREGWALAQDAQRALAAGRPELSQKRFGKARKRFERATELDARYYQAWNMLGYCARQCGDLEAAFDAYGRCLDIEPEYEEAHEYLGETYLKAGQIDKAKAELEWLRSRKSEEADALAEKIARAEQGGAADAWKGPEGSREGAPNSAKAEPR